MICSMISWTWTNYDTLKNTPSIHGGWNTLGFGVSPKLLHWNLLWWHNLWRWLHPLGILHLRRQVGVWPLASVLESKTSLSQESQTHLSHPCSSLDFHVVHQSHSTAIDFDSGHWTTNLFWYRGWNNQNDINQIFINPVGFLCPSFGRQ